MTSVKKTLLLLSICLVPNLLWAPPQLTPEDTVGVPINPAFLYLMVAGAIGFVAHRKRKRNQ